MIHMPQGIEWFVILGIALLIFGKNLPQVGRSVGRTFVEFKKGLKGVQNEIDHADREADLEIEKAEDPAQLT